MKFTNNKYHTVYFIISIIFISIFSNCAQPQVRFEDYAGLWKGKASTTKDFKINVSIESLENSEAHLILSNHRELFRKTFTMKDTLNIPLDNGLVFKGIVNEDKTKINSFITLGVDFYPL